MTKDRLIALRLRGATCRDCANFWNDSYCVPNTDIDSPICGAFAPFPEDKRNGELEYEEPTFTMEHKK